jgi:hypothetical protein
MSRIKIFTMLFLTLVLGMLASVFFHQQWVRTYRTNVLQPELVRDRMAAQATIDLFAFEKLHLATNYVQRSTRLLEAFRQADAKKRHDSVYDELNAMRAKKELKGSAFVAATDAKGQGFANAASINWKKDMAAYRPVTQASSGVGSHGLVVHEKKPYVFVTVPVVGTPAPAAPPKSKTDDSGDDDSGSSDDDDKKTKQKPKPRPRAKSAKGKKKCPAGKELYCFWKCLKRKKPAAGKKKGKCAKWTKPCYCRTPKKKSGLWTPKQTVRMAQKSDDDDSSDDKAPEKRTAPKPQKPVVLGVVVVAFEVGQGLANEIKKSTGLDVEFLSAKGTLFGGTLSAKDRSGLKSVLSGQSPAATAMKALDQSKAFIVSLAGQNEFVSLSAPVGKGKAAGVVLLRPVSSVYGLFREFGLMALGIVLIGFLLALILILPGVGKFQRRLEEMEVVVLEAYNTGNLNVSFREDGPGVLGPFGSTLNKFFTQLRGEPDADDEQLPSDAMPWNAIADGGLNDAAQSAGATEQATTGGQPSTNEMILHFLENPDAHYEEVFTLYHDAKVKVGEDVSRLKKDGFIEKLRRNAADYTEKYDCKGVLFDVTIKDDKVILKPQLIPKD